MLAALAKSRPRLRTLSEGWPIAQFVRKKARVSVPFSSFTSDAGINAVPSRLSTVIAPTPTVLVVPLISAPYIPSNLHSELLYGTNIARFSVPSDIRSDTHT